MGMMEELIERSKISVKTTRYLAIVIGDIGTGKTRLLKTARLPVLVHSFDKGGMLTLRHEIADGTVVADTRWEADDRKSPSVYLQWEAEFHKLKAAKAFDNFGTFAMDSLTGWGKSLMNKIVNSRRSYCKDGAPDERSYMIYWLEALDLLNELYDLPCDVILTGHIRYDKHEVVGDIVTSILMPGRAAPAQMPIDVDEVYIAQSDYRLLTTPEGFYHAKSRLMLEGKLGNREAPDIKAILRKAGLSDADKPMPWRNKK